MDTLSTILDAVWVGRPNLSHKKCIREVIRALLLTLSVNLLKLARVAFAETRPLSTLRRIERVLASKVLKPLAVGRSIVKALPKQKKYILTMDRTTWELGKRVYNILAIGICFDGISIPIYSCALPKRGATNHTEQIAFMEQVLDIIPAEKIECLVADREFGYLNFITWLQSKNIPYCLRLRESSYISDATDGKSRKAKTVLSSLPAGGSVVLAHPYLVNSTLKVRIYAVRRHVNDERESLLILATPVESSFTDTIYRLRWQIETAFRAMKTVGFNMEQTHLDLGGRFEQMLDMVLIAYACAFIEGLIRIRSCPIPQIKKNGRRRFSIFTWGLNLLTANIWASLAVNDTGPESDGS